MIRVLDMGPLKSFFNIKPGLPRIFARLQTRTIVLLPVYKSAYRKESPDSTEQSTGE